MFCEKCGTEQKAGEKFCRKCGTQFPVLDTIPLSNTGNRNATSNIKHSNFHEGGQIIIESTMPLCEFEKLLLEIFKHNYDDVKNVYTVREEEGVYWIDFSTVFNTRLIVCKIHHVDNKCRLIFGYKSKGKLWGIIRLIAIALIVYLLITANFIVLCIGGFIWGCFSSFFWNKFACNRCSQYIRDIDYAIQMKS